MIWAGLLLASFILLYLSLTKRTAFASTTTPFVSRPKKIADSPQEFRQLLYPIAKELERKYGIKAEILIAHAGYETGHGKYVIDNNLFGIKKGSDWKGETVIVKTKEYDKRTGAEIIVYDEFRKYNSIRDSLEDYVNLIKNKPIYKKAWEVRNDPRKYYLELERAGYSTKPGFASELLAVYRMYA